MNKKNKIGVILTTVLSMLIAFSVFSPAEASDVQGHWAEKQINDWLGSGLANGYPDGTFKPDSSITRAEFAALANKAFDYTEEKDIHYSDVAPAEWFAGEMAKAAGAGYIAGYGDGTARPDAMVSRQEAAAMLAKILKLDTAANVGAAAKFVDAKDIPGWSRGAVGAVSVSGYMLGYPDNTYRPEKEITRAEAVVALAKVRAALGDAGDKDITYDKAGIFGPVDGNETVKGNINITVPGVTLRNATITGDLILEESAGDGETILSNITVQGQTIIKDGGPKVVKLDNCSLSGIVSGREGVRLEASGSTGVDTASLERGAALVEKNGTGPGFETVTLSESLPAGSRIDLDGNFTGVGVYSEGVKLYIAGGTTDGIEVAKEADGASIDVGQKAKVTAMTLDAPVTVTGKGVIVSARITVSGCTFEKQPNTVDKEDNITITVGGSGTANGSESESDEENDNKSLEFLGAFLASTGEEITSADVPLNPKIRLVFDRGVVKDYWENNRNCIFMRTTSGDDVPIDVTRIAGLESDERYIYFRPYNDLTPGTSYRIKIDESIRSDNGHTMEDDETVVFGLAPAGEADGDN